MSTKAWTWPNVRARLIDQGWTVAQKDGRHFVCTPPDGQPKVTIAPLSRESRALKNSVRDLKRSGFSFNTESVAGARRVLDVVPERQRNATIGEQLAAKGQDMTPKPPERPEPQKLVPYRPDPRPTVPYPDPKAEAPPFVQPSLPESAGEGLPKEFGPRLRTLRTAAGVSQREVGDMIGLVGGSNVSNWECGRGAIPTTEMFRALVGLFPGLNGAVVDGVAFYVDGGPPPAEASVAKPPESGAKLERCVKLLNFLREKDDGQLHIFRQDRSPRPVAANPSKVWVVDPHTEGDSNRYRGVGDTIDEAINALLAKLRASVEEKRRVLDALLE